MDEDEKSQYQEKLMELVERGADRNIIALLTEIAEEHANLSESNAADIVKIIENRIREASPKHKLHVFYVMDSILKNKGNIVKGVYKRLFKQNIESLFCETFELVEPRVKESMKALHKTWTIQIKDPNDPTKVITNYIFEPVLLERMKQVFTQRPSQVPQQTVYVNPDFLQNPQAKQLKQDEINRKKEESMRLVKELEAQSIILQEQVEKKRIEEERKQQLLTNPLIPSLINPLIPPLLQFPVVNPIALPNLLTPFPIIQPQLQQPFKTLIQPQQPLEMHGLKNKIINTGTPQDIVSQSFSEEGLDNMESVLLGKLISSVFPTQKSNYSVKELLANRKSILQDADNYLNSLSEKNMELPTNICKLMNQLQELYKLREKVQNAMQANINPAHYNKNQRHNQSHYHENRGNNNNNNNNNFDFLKAMNPSKNSMNQIFQGDNILDWSNCTDPSRGAAELVAKLYDPSMIQCVQCGVRFKDKSKMEPHLDWHFRNNRREREKTKKAFSRPWFLPYEIWISTGELAAESARKVLLKDDKEEEAEEVTYVVIAREDQLACPVCKEDFE